MLRKKQQKRLPKKPQKSPKRVLVIDPGTKSTGWSFWIDKVLVEHGTIQCNNPKDKWQFRLAEIGAQYKNLADMLKPDHVFIERLVRNTHIYVHYSVGHLAAIFAARGILSSPTISIKSWESHVKWHNERRPLTHYFKGNWIQQRANGKPLEVKHFRGIKSEDEGAAIGMGKWLFEVGDLADG